jgi:Zn-dependent M16 (insulinase) family peptidase
MTIREEILSTVQELPDSALAEVFEVVEKIKKRGNQPSLMERLRAIKIEGPPDFAENFDLYMNGEKSLDDYFDKLNGNGNIR